MQSLGHHEFLLSNSPFCVFRVQLVRLTLVMDRFGFRSIASHRVRTHPGKPGIYWNLIIGIPGLKYTGISSKVLENTGI